MLSHLKSAKSNNHLKEECFDICEKEEADIYEIAFELLKNKMVLSAVS